MSLRQLTGSSSVLNLVNGLGHCMSHNMLISTNLMSIRYYYYLTIQLYINIKMINIRILVSKKLKIAFLKFTKLLIVLILSGRAFQNRIEAQ